MKAALFRSYRTDLSQGRDALSLIPAALLLSGCEPAPDSFFGPREPSYKYRLTAVIDTPQGERAGSSVIAVFRNAPAKWAGTLGSASVAIEGEAVGVDLPGGKTLFVLLRSPGDSDWAGHVDSFTLADRGDPNELVSPEYFAAVWRDRRVHPVPATKMMPWGEVSNLPYFARFRNIHDPMSVEEVDPADLARTFGRGYRLNSLTVQMADDPVTRNLGVVCPGWRAAITNLHRHLMPWHEPSPCSATKSPRWIFRGRSEP